MISRPPRTKSQRNGKYLALTALVKNCSGLFFLLHWGELKTDGKHYEFGGVPGNLLLIIFLPFVVYSLYFCLRYNDGLLIPAGITLEDVRRPKRPARPPERNTQCVG